MKYLILLLSALIFPYYAAFAQDSFEERVRNANRLEHAADQQGYQAALTASLKPKMVKLVSGCSGSLNGARPHPFTLVGDITRGSSLEDIVVKPDNAFSRCFAGALSRVSFPKPPVSFNGNGYPITMHLNFH